MNKIELVQFIKNLVSDTVRLKNKHIDLHDIPINYACVFAHNSIEYEELYKVALEMGKIVHSTEMGDIFHIEPIITAAGTLQLLKIRKPDANKPGRGYADFTVPNYELFKEKYLSNPNFKLTDRGDYEMIGLKDSEFDVAVYFMNPPMDEKLGICQVTK